MSYTMNEAVQHSASKTVVLPSKGWNLAERSSGPTLGIGSEESETVMQFAKSLEKFAHVVKAPASSEDSVSLPEELVVKTQTDQGDMIGSLSEEQTRVIAKFQAGENIFVSGPGGSGKSYLTKYLSMTATRKPIQFTSTTGCSSVLLSSVIGPTSSTVRTINSWSGVRLCKGDPAMIIQSVLKNIHTVKAWRKLKTLVIDEVSMLSKKLFDILEELGRKTRMNSLPFGGIQVIFLGDMYQLAPIPDIGDLASGLFCFESDRWYDVFPLANHIALTRIYRQKDTKFQEILNQVRVGELSKENADILKSYIDREYRAEEHNGVTPIKIHSTRQQVMLTNASEYAKNVETEQVYEGQPQENCRKYIDTDKPIPHDVLMAGLRLSTQAKHFEMGLLKSNCPVEEVLKLKMGSPVMCLVNLDLERGIANGTLGTIQSFTERRSSGGQWCTLPVVQFSNGMTCTITPHTWQHQEYPNLIYSHLPLCLSYSSTIHKLQGSTLDLAEMNLGGNVFADGQVYVGLSRVKSLEGLYLTAFHAKKIRVNEKARAFYAKFCT